MVDSSENNKFDLRVKWLTKVTMWFQQPPPSPHLPPTPRHFEKGRGGGRDKSSLPGVNRVRMYDTYMLMCL